MGSNLLESLSKKLGCATDAELSRMLGISTAAMSKIKSGQNEMAISTKLRALDRLGYLYARDALLSTTPTKFAELIKKSDNARAKKERLRSLLDAVDTALIDHDPNQILDAVQKKLADLPEKSPRKL